MVAYAMEYRDNFRAWCAKRGEEMPTVGRLLNEGIRVDGGISFYIVQKGYINFFSLLEKNGYSSAMVLLESFGLDILHIALSLDGASVTLPVDGSMLETLHTPDV